MLKVGQNKFQLGANDNLFDWTYIDNVVHAHLLAAEKLDRKVPLSFFLESPPPVGLTLGRRKIPTSETVEKDEAVTNLTLPANRNRFDQFAVTSLESVVDEKGQDYLTVAGSAFYITGGEPIFFWDFGQAIWHEYGGYVGKPWTFPKMFAIWLTGVTTAVTTLIGRKSAFTREKVLYSTATRWYNIERARIMLDYEPVVGVEEGIKRGVAVSLVLPASLSLVG